VLEEALRAEVLGDLVYAAQLMESVHELSAAARLYERAALGGHRVPRSPAR